MQSAMALVFFVATMLPLAFALEGAQIYHSASLLAYDYAQMAHSFKIFVYPELNNSEIDFRSRNAAFRGTMENFWFESLAASRFVTNDPEEADLFLLPVSIATILHDRGSRRVSPVLRSYIQQLRDRFPYWQRALGTDHVYISCSDFKSDSSRNILELKKNAIQIACFPLAGDQDFFPHKDISMPPRFGNAIGRRFWAPQRRYLLCFPKNFDISPSIAGIWRQDPDLVSGDLKMHAATSKFCIGSDRAAIIDSIRRGCVPVIIFDGKFFHDLPLQDVIDWYEFSLVISVGQVAKLREILGDVLREGRYPQLATNIRSASKHFEWNHPPQPRDAFHMVLYQLWKRRHATRYADRST